MSSDSQEFMDLDASNPFVRYRDQNQGEHSEEESSDSSRDATEGEEEEEEEEEATIMANADLKLAGLQPFFGQKNKDTVSAKAWAQQVDYAKTVTNLTDAKTAAYAATALQGDAGTWLMSLKERRSTEINNWETMRKAFMARFHEKKTTSQKHELKRSLRQKPDEPVRAFYDRVDVACFALEEEWPQPPEDYNDGQQTCYLKAYAVLHDVLLQEYFLEGLRAEIRDVVMTNNPDTLAAALAKAVDVESTLKEKHPGRAVHQVQIATGGAAAPAVTEEKLKDMVAAIIRQQTGQGGSAGSSSQQKKDKEKKPRLCFYCGGNNHIEPSCFKKKDDAAKDVYEPVDKERSRPHKKQLSAVAVGAVQQQQTGSATACQGHCHHQGGEEIYDMLASGNAPRTW